MDWVACGNRAIIPQEGGWLGWKGSNRALQFSNLSQDDDPKEIRKFGRAERKLPLPMAVLDGSRQEKQPAVRNVRLATYAGVS